ncbi:MAG: hypothetical protein JNM17_25100 [Archangium sp.]|nr:hypothetical protein [Archangium sp.]
MQIKTAFPLAAPRGALLVVVGSLALAGTGCTEKKTNTEAKAAPAKPAPVKIEVATQKTQALGASLKKLGADQKLRSKELARIAKDPKVKSNPRLASAARALAQQQTEVALLTQRTAAAVAKGDPRARAYQQALGASIARADRTAHAFATAGFKAGLSKKSPPKQWLPNQKGAMPRAQAVASANVNIGAALYALDAAYDAERAMYLQYDQAFDATYASVQANAWLQFDVQASLAHVSRNELAYTFNQYLSTEDLEFYSAMANIPEFTDEELAMWSDGHAWDAERDGEGTPCDLDLESPEELASLEHDVGITESELMDEDSWSADADDADDAVAKADDDDAPAANDADDDQPAGRDMLDDDQNDAPAPVARQADDQDEDDSAEE